MKLHRQKVRISEGLDGSPGTLSPHAHLDHSHPTLLGLGLLRTLITLPLACLCLANEDDRSCHTRRRTVDNHRRRKSRLSATQLALPARHTLRHTRCATAGFNTEKTKKVQGLDLCSLEWSGVLHVLFSGYLSVFC
jgi:hypothetical protein